MLPTIHQQRTQADDSYDYSAAGGHNDSYSYTILQLFLPGFFFLARFFFLPEADATSVSPSQASAPCSNAKLTRVATSYKADVCSIKKKYLNRCCYSYVQKLTHIVQPMVDSRSMQK